MKKLPNISLLLLVLATQAAYGDRGSIPFNPNVKIFEPAQRAMIAWNGQEQILLLSTDLRASEPTRVLEVLPLPSEPVVKKGDVEVFRRAIALIDRKLRQRYGPTRGRGPEKAIQREPAGEVTFHEKIGAHDISTTHVLNSKGFVEWVENYPRSAGVRAPTVSGDMKTVVAEYLQEGFTWFVFDVVSLDRRPKTSEAIQYRFATKSLFYPLKITRTGEGRTSIGLLVLTIRLLRHFPGIPISQVKLPHEPVTISSQELRDLSEEMHALLGHRETMQLRIWRIQAGLSSFRRDLIAR